MQAPVITTALAGALTSDRLAYAAAQRRGTWDGAAPAPEVTIRPAVSSDGPALARLQGLDGGAVLAGGVLVAESAGEIVAARSLADGRVVADPFRSTAELVALLEVRAAQLSGRRPARPRRRGAARARRPMPVLRVGGAR